jgi:hypothetical protein
MKLFFSLLLLLNSIFSFPQKNEKLLKRNSKIAIIVKDSLKNIHLINSINLLKDVLDNSLMVEVKFQNEITNNFDFYFIVFASLEDKSENNTFNEECFSIEQKENNKILFKGFDENALSNGIVTFIEKFLGFNYFYPNEDFKSYKKTRKLVLKNINIKECPSFLQRQLSPVKIKSKGTVGDFALSNKLNEKINFHHSFNNLINREVYINNNDFFFPVIKGKRYLPKDEKDYDWQPNFKSEILADTLVNLFFKKYQKEKVNSFSLAINDSGNFDESELSTDYENNNKNFLKKVNYSNDYYSFVNSVSYKLQQFNFKFNIGVLAYSNVIEPPNFKLNENVIPFITADRMRWSNEQLKINDQNLCNSWLLVAKNIGFYDYLYGSFYLIPRLYPKIIKKSLNWAKENGVKYYYAESYYNFTEGSKIWILSKLLWNENYDIDSLNNIWNNYVFGAKSSKYMERYFDNWENFWDSDIKNSDWFIKTSQYLPFSNLEYLSIVDTNIFINNILLLNKAFKNAKNEFNKTNINHYIKFNQIQFDLVKFIMKQPSKNQTLKALKSNDEFMKLLRTYFDIFDNEKTFKIMQNLIENK